MKILITGAGGFIGKNLIATLESEECRRLLPSNEIQLYKYDIDTAPHLLDAYCRDCDFVFHLAGINRPKSEEEFMEGNFGFTSTLLTALIKNGNACPVMLSSSIQAALDNPYGRSKKAGEELLLAYGRENGTKVLIYRFPNVFGKWCRPNYNSAVATFCYNIARDLPVTVNDPATQMKLVYIDDVVKELIGALLGRPHYQGEYCAVPVIHEVKLGHIVELLKMFKESRNTREVPNMEDAFARKLYATYLSYLPEDGFSYSLIKHEDARGSFTELLRSAQSGQISVNISKPGIVKGNHWHHTKNEKFIVVSGQGVIRFRKVGESAVKEYYVSGDKPEVVDIPTGYTHNIENLGQTEMVTLMWASECFDPENPDTYFMEV